MTTGFWKVELSETRTHSPVTATSPVSMFRFAAVSCGLTVIVVEVVAVAPKSSVTWRVAMKLASVVYVWETVLPLAELPSPKCHV